MSNGTGLSGCSLVLHHCSARGRIHLALMQSLCRIDSQANRQTSVCINWWQDLCNSDLTKQSYLSCTCHIIYYKSPCGCHIRRLVRTCCFCDRETHLVFHYCQNVGTPQSNLFGEYTVNNWFNFHILR